MSISTANPQVATLTRYRFVAVGSETSVSGVDANGSVLAYVVGKEQVYLNGVLLVRGAGQDYTATNGTSITGLTALAANDVVEVLTFSEFVIANAVDQTLVNTKGDLIVATADNVVTNVAVGANDTVLVADSAQTAGVKWAVPTDTTKIPNSLVDAKGDLLTATADNTPARLAVGTDGQVLTASSSASTGLAWSSAGVTWTRRLATSTGAAFTTIAYNGSNLYVAAAQSGYLYTSPDGKTWTSRTSGFGANNIFKVIYVSGLSLWIAVGSNGTITTSTDGTTWTARTANMSTNSIYDVYAVGTTVVAVGLGGGTTNTGGITYSTDGTTWTRKSQTPTIGTNYTSVTHNGTNWVVTANPSTNNALYASTPSGTWTAFVVGSGAVSLTYSFYDGTGTIFIRTDGSPYYTTSTTYGSATLVFPYLSNSNATLMMEGQQRAYYYNGKLYWTTWLSTGPAAYLLGELTTANSSGYWNDYKPFAFAPGTGFSTSVDAYWVGAAGQILGCNGQIYTSF